LLAVTPEIPERLAGPPLGERLVELGISVLAIALQVRNSGHGQHGKNVGQVLVVENDNRRPPHRNLVRLPHLVLLAICHSDLKWNTFLDGHLNLISRHKIPNQTYPMNEAAPSAERPIAELSDAGSQAHPNRERPFCLDSSRDTSPPDVECVTAAP